jgi:hypothetical protein
MADAADFRARALEAQMTTPWTMRARLVRRLGLEHNPLRRTSDKIEAGLLLAMIVSFVPLTVLTASGAAHWVGHASVAGQRADQPRQVRATLLASTPARYPVIADSAWVPARWTAYGGTHTGNVLVAGGLIRGATVVIWVDRSGREVTAPPDHDQLMNRVLTVIAGAPLAIALAMFLLFRSLRWALSRRRLAGWDEAWAAFSARQTKPH